MREILRSAPDTIIHVLRRLSNFVFMWFSFAFEES